MIAWQKLFFLSALLGVAAVELSLAQSISDSALVPELPDPPKTRAETWLDYQENADGSGQYKITEKVYLPLGVSADGWRFTGRLDVPLLDTNKEGPANSAGDWQIHVGDILTELYATTPPVAPDLTLGASLRLVWPTGGPSPFGDGQYQWAPALYLSYRRPDLGYGMTFHPLARYFMSYHAATAGASAIRKLDLYPTVSFDLPDHGFIALYPENPIVYNEITHQWFVPFEAMAGKKISERLHVGFGGAVKLGGNDPQYQYLLEARVRWLF
jgi:hypothetical protein